MKKGTRPKNDKIGQWKLISTNCFDNDSYKHIQIENITNLLENIKTSGFLSVIGHTYLK